MKKTNCSLELSWRLAQFIACLVNGHFSDPENLAIALDRLSDAAWAEAERRCME